MPGHILSERRGKWLIPHIRPWRIRDLPLFVYLYLKAPCEARMPCRMVAPSNAGPLAHDGDIGRFRLPRISSPFVPTSIMSVISSRLYGSSAIRTPTVSAPTNPAITGSRCIGTRRNLEPYFACPDIYLELQCRNNTYYLIELSLY